MAGVLIVSTPGAQEALKSVFAAGAPALCCASAGEARRALLGGDYALLIVNTPLPDEFGRELTPKEAWKALSHKFHGKGSGKAKTEKRLKKIAEERKKEAMASGDTPLSMNQAFQIRQEKTGQAHFVLSVGNRGCVFFVIPSCTV